MSITDYHPSQLEELLKVSGIQLKQVPRYSLPRSSSPFQTLHLVRDREFLVAESLDEDECAHEMGHLIVWDLLGRPEGNNFGCDGYDGFDEDCQNLIKSHGYWPFMIYEKPIYPHHKHWSFIETPACAIEAAIIRRTRKSRRGTYTQLRYENFIQEVNSRKEREDTVTMMLDFGERLLRQHAELLEERACKRT